MAFTEAQRVKLRMFLGYPDVFRQYNPRLESCFDVIGGRPDTQAEIEVLMDRIDEADAVLAGKLTYAGLKRAEDIEWYQNSSSKFSTPMDAARALGTMLIGRVSRTMGVPLAGAYFGTQGYDGDGFMGPGIQQSGRGGMIPLG